MLINNADETKHAELRCQGGQHPGNIQHAHYYKLYVVCLQHNDSICKHLMTEYIFLRGKHEV